MQVGQYFLFFIFHFKAICFVKSVPEVVVDCPKYPIKEKTFVFHSSEKFTSNIVATEVTYTFVINFNKLLPAELSAAYPSCDGMTVEAKHINKTKDSLSIRFEEKAKFDQATLLKKCYLNSATSGTCTPECPPTFNIKDASSKIFKEGDSSVKIICPVMGTSQDFVVYWTKTSNETITNGQSNINYQTNVWANDTIVFEKLTKSENGLILVCNAKNKFGEGKIMFRLIVKGRFSALWPFLGIVAEIIMLATFILLCGNRQKNPAVVDEVIVNNNNNKERLQSENIIKEAVKNSTNVDNVRKSA